MRFCTLFLLIILSACSFHSIYNTNGVINPAELTVVMISTDYNNKMYEKKFQNLLEKRFSEFSGKDKKYTLNVTLTKTKYSVATQSTGSTSRYNINTKIVYSIKDKNGFALYTGSLKSISSFESSEQRFANVALENDNIEKSLQILANDLTMEIISLR